METMNPDQYPSVPIYEVFLEGIVRLDKEEFEQNSHEHIWAFPKEGY